MTRACSWRHVADISSIPFGWVRSLPLAGVFCLKEKHFLHKSAHHTWVVYMSIEAKSDIPAVSKNGQLKPTLVKKFNVFNEHQKIFFISFFPLSIISIVKSSCMIMDGVWLTRLCLSLKDKLFQHFLKTMLAHTRKPLQDFREAPRSRVRSIVEGGGRKTRKKHYPLRHGTYCTVGSHRLHETVPNWFLRG